MSNETCWNEIEQLLAEIDPQNECFNATEIQGLLFAVAITPELITPNEWLPIIFGDTMPQYVDLEPMQQLLGMLFNAYNHYITLHQGDSLHFPYNPKQMTPNLSDRLMDWCVGFWNGLQLRSELWISELVANQATLNLDEDSLDKSFKIIQFLADENFDDAEFLNQMLQVIPAELNEDDAKMYAESSCLELLPTLVENIQQFAKKIKTSGAGQKIQPMQATPFQSTRVARNDPCPCGSGKKYKKCCLH